MRTDCLICEKLIFRDCTCIPVYVASALISTLASFQIVLRNIANAFIIAVVH